MIWNTPLDFSSVLESVIHRKVDAIAVTDLAADEPVSYSYAQLGLRVQELKSVISRRTRPDEKVAIILPTGAESVCAFWATVCAGRCYVPLHIDGALDRLVTILRDTEPALIVVQESALQSLHAISERLGYREIERSLGVAFLHKPTTKHVSLDEEPAAIVYTSGSTGAPKGIAHSLVSLSSAIMAFHEIFPPSEDERVFTTIPHHFDVAIFDIFSYILGGAEIVIPNPRLFENPRKLCDFLSSEGITCFHAVATTNHLVLTYGKPERLQYPKLRTVITGGEVLTVETARKVHEVFPKAALHNVYGPAEIICCSYFSVPSDYFSVPRQSIPIGKIFGVGEFHVAEDGELWVSGRQLMLGYWHNPELTREKIHVVDGKRWYATGDLVFFNDDGWLEYRCRRDRMVKRRGIRIELDDIQKNIGKMPGIGEVGVISKPDAFQGCRIIAHVRLLEGESRDAFVLKTESEAFLPTEMIPDKIEIHTELPHTSTGKIDYQALTQRS